MSKLTVLLVIAQNGLATASRFLETDAARKESRGDEKGARKNRQLAKVLGAADAGIREYLAIEAE
jgi:hypothetical protein